MTGDLVPEPAFDLRLTERCLRCSPPPSWIAVYLRTAGRALRRRKVKCVNLGLNSQVRASQGLLSQSASRSGRGARKRISSNSSVRHVDCRRGRDRRQRERNYYADRLEACARRTPPYHPPPPAPTRSDTRDLHTASSRLSLSLSFPPSLSDPPPRVGHTGEHPPTKGQLTAGAPGKSGAASTH